jgi:ArsR family transcriptional regulator
LAEASLVDVRRSGTWALYSRRVQAPASEGAADTFPPQLLELLDASWDDAGPDTASVERVLRKRRRATSVFFRDAAADWDRLRDRTLGPPHHVDRLLELVGDGGTVVDLGTGTGVLLPRLAPSSARLIGIDASPEMLELAQRRVEEAALPRTDLRLGRLEHLPLSDGEADTMIANLVLHHVADPREVLREIRRGLAEGGRLLIADLEERDDEPFWKALGARWPGFRPQEVEEWLAAAGFRSVRTEIAPDDRTLTAGESNGERPGVFLIAATNTPSPRRNA